MAAHTRIDIQRTLPDGTTYTTTTVSEAAAEQIFNSLVNRFPDHVITLVAGSRTLRRHPSRLTRGRGQ